MNQPSSREAEPSAFAWIFGAVLAGLGVGARSGARPRAGPAAPPTAKAPPTPMGASQRTLSNLLGHPCPTHSLCTGTGRIVDKEAGFTPRPTLQETAR